MLARSILGKLSTTKNMKIRFLKDFPCKGGEGKPGIFWFSLIFSLKSSLRPLGYCAPCNQVSYVRFGTSTCEIKLNLNTVDNWIHLFIFKIITSRLTAGFEPITFQLEDHASHFFKTRAFAIFQFRAPSNKIGDLIQKNLFSIKKLLSTLLIKNRR